MLSVHACPRAASNAIQGLHGDSLKIRLRAPPVDGKANDALIAYLAEQLGIPARDIGLVSGTTGRHKRILIRHSTTRMVADRLGMRIQAT